MNITTTVLSQAELDSMAGADEVKVIELCQVEHERVLLEHPEYADWIEDIDPYVCPRQELIDALRKAPNGFVRQYLFSIFAFRQSINLVAGRSFL
ncbi:hypothetical protein [Massilia alkalitolerans]|uniref:hypothetical protein n=1 Tax=Massilia alkalitolerans TaxID=286638 RepID=UPI000412439E|nr:hypothetical protein [Massilia alkalitolerans]